MAVGNWTWSSVLAGAAASGWLALLWMYNSSPTRQRERQQQRQQGAGGWHGAAGAAGPAGPGGAIRHLRNEVPKGAPDAVARILMVRAAGSSRREARVGELVSGSPSAAQLSTMRPRPGSGATS